MTILQTLGVGRCRDRRPPYRQHGRLRQRRAAIANDTEKLDIIHAPVPGIRPVGSADPTWCPLLWHFNFARPRHGAAGRGTRAHLALTAS